MKIFSIVGIFFTAVMSVSLIDTMFLALTEKTWDDEDIYLGLVFVNGILAATLGIMLILHMLGL